MNEEYNWMYAFGCDNGLIRLTSTAYTSDYHQTFTQQYGHTAVVHALTWNKFNPELLATASEDNYIKIFQIKKPKPLYSYDLQAPVIAVTFSNAVSTVLLAGTAHNKVHVFDFDQNTEKELCI